MVKRNAVYEAITQVCKGYNYEIVESKRTLIIQSSKRFFVDTSESRFYLKVRKKSLRLMRSGTCCWD